MDVKLFRDQLAVTKNGLWPYHWEHLQGIGPTPSGSQPVSLTALLPRYPFANNGLGMPMALGLSYRCLCGEKFKYYLPKEKVYGETLSRAVDWQAVDAREEADGEVDEVKRVADTTGAGSWMAATPCTSLARPAPAKSTCSTTSAVACCRHRSEFD